MINILHSRIPKPLRSEKLLHLAKKNCVFLSSILFKVVPKDRFSSNFYSAFTDLLETDVEKCKKIYRRCFLQSLIKNHGSDPKQGKNTARICSPA